MAGVPYHAVEQYLAKLIRLGAVGCDLRADRRSGHQQGAGRAQGDARRDTGHADRRRSARRASAIACWSRCMRRPAGRHRVAQSGRWQAAPARRCRWPRRPRCSSASTPSEILHAGRRADRRCAGAPARALPPWQLRSRHRRAHACASNSARATSPAFGADDAPLGVAAAGASARLRAGHAAGGARARPHAHRRARNAIILALDARDAAQSGDHRDAARRQPRRRFIRCSTAAAPRAGSRLLRHWLANPLRAQASRRFAPRGDRGDGRQRGIAQRVAQRR